MNLALSGCTMIPPWLKTHSTCALNAVITSTLIAIWYSWDKSLATKTKEYCILKYSVRLSIFSFYLWMWKNIWKKRTPESYHLKHKFKCYKLCVKSQVLRGMSWVMSNSPQVQVKMQVSKRLKSDLMKILITECRKQNKAYKSSRLWLLASYQEGERIQAVMCMLQVLVNYLFLYTGVGGNCHGIPHLYKNSFKVVSYPRHHWVSTLNGKENIFCRHNRSLGYSTYTKWQSPTMPLWRNVKL